MKLYEINQAIIDCLSAETGEILDEERLAELQIAREEKIKNVGEWYKNLCAEAAAYKAEKDSFAAKQRAAEKKAESLKKWLDYALQGEAFKSTTVSISYRKSEQVVVDDFINLDPHYIKFGAPQADKTAIKKALKEGIQIAGVHLEQKNNISIK